MVLALSGTVSLAEVAERGTRAVPERPARVFVMASFASDCAPAAAPQITIDRPPAKGTVSFRAGQMTTVQYSLTGKCVGARVPGTGIYYTARVGESGRDTFSITARLPTGETASRTFTIEIED
jgi:hypothetical protein